MPDVLYICDREACEVCINKDCIHTTDINHAKNFVAAKKYGEVDFYMELDPYMSANEYQKECLRTESKFTDEEDLYLPQYKYRILQGLMGLVGESGECMDLFKKHLFQGHDLDKEKMAEELGDVAWYLAVTADAIDCDLEYIFLKNIEKLKKRYPDGFDADKSVNREE